MYAAASLVRVDPGSATLGFSNAGLPYPFVLRAKERRLDEVPLAAPPLGLLPGELAQYESRSQTLASGDVLLVGSDGLGSIVGPDDEFFEDRQLRKVLGQLAGMEGDKVIEALMDKALGFGGGRPLPDDVNLLAVTRVGS
jgi:sigma-B regulation protein RsbU (phosphoserine phosphatase)